MTGSADIIRFLVEKGVALDVALQAAEIAEQGLVEALKRDSNVTRNVTERDEKRRKADAARQKRWRDNNVTLRDNNVTERDECTAALVPQVKNLSSFSKVSKKEESKEDSLEALVSERNVTQRDKRGTRLPSDWTPNDPDFANEILRDRAHTELENFRDYWIAQPGQRGLKLDWEATWRRWVRTANERTPPHRNGGIARANQKSQLMQAFDRLEERMNREAESTDSELRESNLFRLPLGPVRGS